MRIWIRRIFLLPVFFYRYILSPVLPKACRFYPTCSEYAVEAIMLHGIGYGSWLALRRILRCHPFGGSGIDLVPPLSSESQKKTQDL